MLNYQVSALVAAGDTVKTSIGEITILKAGKVVGVWCYATGVAGLTTIVPNSGIFELESAQVNNLLPASFPLSIAQALASGASDKDVKVWPMDLPCKANDKVECKVTMDVAQTGANACRWGLVVQS
jgi:hypothetical protein